MNSRSRAPCRATPRRLLDDGVRQLVAVGAGDVDVDAEHRRRVRERDRDVVAVADEGDASGRAACPSAPAASGNRRAPGTGCSSSVSALMTCSRGAAAANSSSSCCENVRMTTASTQRSRLRATSATGSRWPSAASGCSATTWPPSSRTAISNVDARAQRRLLEQHRHVTAVERVRRSAPARPSDAVRLQPARRDRGSARDRRRRNRGPRGNPCGATAPLHDSSSASHRPRQVRYSALIRTYSALRSQVQTVDDARAGAEVDARRCRRPSGTRRPPAPLRRTAGRP